MPEPVPFSRLLWERTRPSHSDSEGAGFMTDLMRGTGTRDDYIALSAQHWYVYRALEAATADASADPVASPFLSPELTRLPAIERDLRFLLGDDWQDQISPVPAATAYAERIAAVGDWAGGLVAHHYTRYLGDLSGGQHIARMMRRHFGFDDEGVTFYMFDIDDLDAFKNGYRAKLDAAPWDEAEQQRIIDEVLKAYAFNSAVFADLAEAKARTAA